MFNFVIMKITKKFLLEQGWLFTREYNPRDQIAMKYHSIGFEMGDVWKDCGRGAILEFFPERNILKITTTDEGYNQDGPNYSIKFFGDCPSQELYKEIAKLIHLPQ